MYRARTEAQQRRRRIFAESVYEDIMVHPVSLQIAQLAGRIEGEQAALGNSIAFEDLIIGATALHLRFDVATFNVKHFKVIPDLKIVSL
jgi:predicted nucleic acid-binding protein